MEAIEKILVEPTQRVSLEQVLKALLGIRIGLAGLEEVALRDMVAAHLRERGLACETEVRFPPRCRADIWIDGIVIEMKKSRPPRGETERQLAKYAASGRVRGLILVLERNMPVEAEIEGIPCRVFSLNSQWGLAV